jgi:hypothetical protein
VVIANHNLELLLADSVGLRPVLVIFPAHSHATHDQQVPAKSNGGTHFKTSLSMMIRLSSFSTAGLMKANQFGNGGEMKWKLAANPIFFFLRTLLPDQRFVLVVRIVGVSELSIRIELKLEELVAELALVAHIVAHIEISILRHCYVIDGVRTIKTVHP